MKFEFKNKIYSFPVNLSEITLKQRIEFHNLYGKKFIEAQEKINTPETTDEVDFDEIANFELYLEMACESVSFFSGIPLEDAFQIPLTQIINLYETCLKSLLNQQEEMELENEFIWGDEIWKLEQPQITYQSEMNFNEFLTSKQIVKSMYDLGNGQWEALPYLCCIFLRKENETFNENWMTEGSERLELMQTLPLDIALQVGFFLRSSMNLFLRTSPFSEVEAEAKART